MTELVDMMDEATTARMARINENRIIIGTVVVNDSGFPEITSMDSLSAVKYATAARVLSQHARHSVRCIDPTDDVQVLRFVTKKTEVLVKPDNEFHIVAVMRKGKLRL